MKNQPKVVFCFIGLMVLSSSVHAAQSNFQIAPPPIAAPEFNTEKADKKIAATYVGMTGTGFDLSGGGANFVVRNAMSSKAALDFSVGAFIMSGKMDFGAVKGDLSAMNIPLAMNFEYQPVKNDSMSVILFGGPLVSFGYSYFKFNNQYQGITRYTYQTILGYSFTTPVVGTVTDTTTGNTTTYLYGLQGGAQGAINAGNFTFSPFAMFQSQQGSASTSISSTSTSLYGNWDSSSSSASIPSFTSISYGFDILYRPWNTTLSSMLQSASKSGTNEGFTTTVISINKNF